MELSSAQRGALEATLARLTAPPRDPPEPVAPAAAERIIQLSHGDIKQTKRKLLMHAKMLIAGRLITHLLF